MPSDLLLRRPERSAHASIRGYLYQACLGALRWLELEPGEVLLCEGDEDLDRYFTSGQRTLEQVKDVSGNLGVTVVRETLRNFLLSWVHLRQQNEGVDFVFTSTAEVGKGSSAWPILNAWEDPDGQDERVETVREWVRNAGGTEEDREAIATGLEWLDTEDDWAEFLGSIRWHLGQPKIKGVRDRIRQRLKARSDTRDLPTENLIDRLICEIFHASSQPEPSDRQRDEEALQRLLEAAKAELVQWSGSPEADRIRKTFDETQALRELLGSGNLDLQELPSERILPSHLLTAGYEVVPFVGRDEEWAEIHAWCEESSNKGVWLWSGEGGVGKSRFFIETCRRLRHQGWHAGFLSPSVDSAQIRDLFRGILPRLVVIDYAETRPENTQVLLERLARHQGEPKVRVVLLARQQGAWWNDLFKGSAKLEHLGNAHARAVTLSPLLENEATRLESFEAAARHFAQKLPDKPLPEPLVEPDLSRDEFQRILYLHMAALAALDGKRLDTAEDLLSATLEHEEGFWRRPGPNALEAADTVKLISRAMAGFTLLGGVETEEQAGTWVPHLLDLPNEPATVRFIRNQLHRLYGTREKYIEALQPDLLGEHLVGQVLAERPHLLDGILDRADHSQRRQVLTVLLRLATRTGDESWLQRLESRLRDSQSQEEIESFSAICITPYFLDAVPLYEVALAAEEQALEWHRKNHSDPTEHELNERARRWNNLGYRLADLGHRKRSIQATQRAVYIYERLAEKQPDEFLPGLAMSLNNLGTRHSAMMQPEKALAATQKANNIYKKLAKQRPDVFLRDLAMSLSNLGNQQKNIGQLDDAIQTSRHAVDILENIVQTNPDGFLPDLARSLDNLGSQYSKVGQPENALQVARRAADIYEKLAAKRPDVFLPDLARIFNNLGNLHAELGQPEKAIEATQQAVDIREMLAEKRPDAFLPDLASSLNNLGVRHAEMDQLIKAIRATKRAVDIRESLAKARPEVFRPELATSLNNLGIRQAELGQLEVAIQSTQRAVVIREKLAEERPEVFLSDLTDSLNSLSGFYHMVGRPEQAMPLSQKVLAIREELVQQYPQTYLPKLAGSLNNIGNLHAEMGQPAKAIQASRRAMGILLPFFEMRPKAHSRWMQKITRGYLKHCQESNVEPNSEWMERVKDVFEELEAADGKNG